MDALEKKIVEPQETEDQEKDKDPLKLDKKNEKKEDPRFKGLLPETVNRINKKLITIDEVIRKQKRLKQEAEIELARIKKEHPDLLDQKEDMAILKDLEEKKDPSQLKKLSEKIKKLPEEKERQGKIDQDKAKKLSPDHKDIKAKKAEVTKMMTEPEIAKWLGTKQIKQYELWAFEAIDKNPSIANAEGVIKRMQEDRKDGIKPRREFFERVLSPMLKKYGIDLNDTPYLKAEGLSERKAAMDLAKKAEKKLDGMRNAGLYSTKAVREIMAELLKADSASKQKEIGAKIESVTAKEAQSYTNINSSIFDETMTVNGVTMKKMSPKSKKLYLDFYKDAGLKDRGEMVLNWKKVVENEAQLAKDLGEVYKADPEGFKKSLKIFEFLDFMEKKKFVEEQKVLVAEQDKETLHKSQEITAKALKAIDEAKEKRAVCNITAKKFKGLFLDSKRFIDPKTKKIDLDKLQKAYDKLTSPKPVSDAENRNLKAYEVERANYVRMYEKLKRDNPDINPEELKRWMDRYDDETFSGRKKIFQDLIKEINERKRKKLEKKKVEKETGITDKEKREAKEKSPERSELIVFVNDCLAEDTEDSIKDAYKALHLYRLANEEKAENDPTFLYLEEVVARRKRELITAGNKDKKKSEKIKDSVERVADSQEFKEKIDESNIREVNIEQTQRSQRRHHNKVSAKERAEEESLEKAGNDQEKRDVIKNYYELTDKKHVLQTEDRETGEEIVDVKFNNVKMTREQIEKNKKEIRGKKERMTKNKGFKDVRIMDDKGRELKAEEATVREGQRQEKLDIQMIEEAEKLAGIRRKVEKPEDSASNLQDRVAMMREARRLRQEKKEEMLKRAA